MTGPIDKQLQGALKRLVLEPPRVESLPTAPDKAPLAVGRGEGGPSESPASSGGGIASPLTEVSREVSIITLRVNDDPDGVEIDIEQIDLLNLTDANGDAVQVEFKHPAQA